jgi:methionyl-tRNA formyltransferase
VAEAAGVPVFTPLSLRKSPEDVETLLALKADVILVAAYGLILPSAVLNAPRFGCINVHASILPRWRGASPIHHAIWAGDHETGITMMQMDQGLDTGAMIATERVPILATTTTPDLQDQLSILGARMTRDVLTRLRHDGEFSSIPQPKDGIILAPILTKEMGRIDWTQDAAAIDRQVRALMPWPGTTTTTPRGHDIKVISGVVVDGVVTAPAGTLLNRDGHIACGDGKIYQVTTAQVPSGKKMSVEAAINGGHIAVGEVLQ